MEEVDRLGDGVLDDHAAGVAVDQVGRLGVELVGKQEGGLVVAEVGDGDQVADEAEGEAAGEEGVEAALEAADRPEEAGERPLPGTMQHWWGWNSSCRAPICLAAHQGRCLSTHSLPGQVAVGVLGA